MTTLSLMTLLLAAAPTPTPVVRAVVFPDRAQVTRRASLECGPAASLAFLDLPTSIDPGSIQASTSVGEVEGLSVQSVAHDRAAGEEARKVEADIRAVARELATLDDAAARLEAQSNSLTQYDAAAVTLAGRERVDPPGNGAAWEQALQLSWGQRDELAQKRIELARKRSRLEERNMALAQRLLRLGAAASRFTLDAEVRVSCPAGQRAQIDLTYLVGGVDWSPTYELRADEKRGQSTLTTYAEVRQRSGEAWKGVQLLLSTAIPRTQATLPQLQPLTVRSEPRVDPNRMLVSRQEAQRHAESATRNAPQQEPSEGESQDQGLSMQLTVPGPADVPGEGEQVRLPISTAQLPATFVSRTAPAMQPFVYRMADMVVGGPLPLLPGPVDVFRGGDFAGRQQVDETIPVGAPWHLTLGLDETVQVKRVVVTEAKKEPGLFGSARRFSFAYRFELRGSGDAPRKVEVRDHIPVVELDDVTLALDPKTTAGWVDPNKEGILQWTVEVVPHATRSVDLGYHLDVPSRYATPGM